MIALALGLPASLCAEEKLEYNRDVRPILAENCFNCHGPDSASRKARLRLDLRDEAVAREVLVPGDPGKSVVIERVLTDDPDAVMPPPKAHKKLTAAQKEVLRRWVAEGAEYQPHWSFLAPSRPEPPAVKNAAWVRNPIDAFVLAKLEKVSLSPAPEADRRTLARRASLDLTGLPPAPELVEAFVNDTAPGAYERYVDRLLESPQWGEHRGRYWLDAARYADTHGIHFDNYREMYAYRDWVINAFNKNLPFDRFTVEQLAGDLLPNRTLDQQVATGFNRCNITTNEGGTIPEEYLVLYTRDRTETVAQVWLGLTANCATCHDHKYDPLTQKQFYEMAAFFNNTTQGAMDGNIKDTPPTVFVPRAEDRPRWEVLAKEIGDARKEAEGRQQTARADYEKWLADAKPDSVASLLPAEGLHLHAPLAEGKGAAVRVKLDGQERDVTAKAPLPRAPGHVAAKALRAGGGGLVIPEAGHFEKDRGFSFGAWIQLPRNRMTGAVFARMDDGKDFRGWDLWVENNQVGTHIIHKWPENAVKVVAQANLKPKEWRHVFVTYDGSGRAAGVTIYLDGVPQGPKTVFADSLKATIKTDVPFKVGQRHNTSPLEGVLVQDVRLFNRSLPGHEVDLLVKGSRAAYVVGKPAAERSAGEKDELFAWWLPTLDGTYQGLHRRINDLMREEAAVKSRGTVAHVSQERPGEPTAYVLYRGEYDQRREQVKADTPDALPPLPNDLPRNRLGFAQWLLRPEHPLTARVTVNRFWQEVFGTGIVRTVGDFGVTGELPTHPELLDWLAVEFRDSGWDVKEFFKTIVTSSTYRQAALVTPDRLAKDTDNRFLSRGPRYRLDAEMIRDYALEVSGQLVKTVGGPSVKPYQPEGVWEAVAMIGSNTRDYRPDSGDKLYRRSLYTFWKRAAPPASLEIMNAPNREFCTVQRERTNTPLQALVTLNDPQLVEAARHLAQRTLDAVAGRPAEHRTAAGIDFMARRVLCRPLRDEEAKVVESSFADLLAYYQGHAEDAQKLLRVGASPAPATMEPAALAAWTLVANEMLNLDEVLNK